VKMRPSMRRFYSMPGRFKTTKSGRQQFRYDLVGKSETHFASEQSFGFRTPAR
jgi:hypothetical protein